MKENIKIDIQTLLSRKVLCYYLTNFSREEWDKKLGARAEEMTNSMQILEGGMNL